MLKNMSRARLAGMWVATVIVVAAASIVAGTAVTVNNGELWLVACLVPPAIMMLVWPNTQPPSVAELLHSVNRPSKEFRS